jgi:hypothetical protein
MKQIRSTVPDIHEEKIFSFVRDDEGFFRKVEKTVYRNRENNEIKQGDEVILENLYRPTLDDDFDDEMSYQDINGEDQVLRLKLVDKDT